MSKKLLILSASPRRHGNSDLLCDEFMKGAREAGHSVEKIFLKDKQIHYCTGCGSCSVMHKPCPQKDDMAEILDKMIAADVIVMASPVYFYTMNAQMKTLIDRTCSRYQEISKKDFYFIMTAADTTSAALEPAHAGFKAFLSCLDEPRECGVIRGTGVWMPGDVKGSRFMKEAYEMGGSIK